MNLRWLNFIIVSIVLAMGGLIYIQIRWVNQAFRAHEERFDQSVYQALNEIERTIEKNEAFNYFETSGVNDMRKTVRQMYDTMQVLKEYYPNFSLVDSIGQNAMKFGFNDTSGNFISKFVGSIQYLQKHAEKIHTHPNDHSISGMSPQERERHIVEMQFKKYNRLFQNLAVQFMLDDKCLAERVSDSVLTPILTTHFQNNGIKIPFQFAVFDNFSDQMLCGNLNIAKTESNNYYSIPLFPNDFYENSGILIVNFPGKRDFILESVWVMLSASIAIILIIIAAFGASFYIIFRQKKVDELKTDFINNMTHEFKTPVATISLASQMLKNDKVLHNPEKILNYSNIIEEENKRLSGHIENVLTAARYDRGEFKLKTKEIDLNSLLENIAESLELRIQNENGVLHTNFAAANSRIVADEFHLTNAFYNLLDNAIKYRKENSLNIWLSTQDASGGVKVVVRDDGIGISKENQPMVFEKFYRVPTGNIHNVKGFGLGLSYVKIILDAHGGNITLKSEAGKGSEFTLFIPARPSS